jgi:hypothetical protein
MKCDHDWTIKFHGVNNGRPFELRPIEMSLRMSRPKYDFCRAKAPFEAGEQMKPHTRYDGGALRGLTPVDVCHNGRPIQRLVFRPDWVDYGSDFTHLQFHDLHKALADGAVDEQRDTIRLTNVYRLVLNATRNRLIDEVKFTLPDNQVRTLYGNKASSLGTFEGAAMRESAERNATKRIVKSDYAMDFENISPEKAIQRLNKKFNLKSWINRSGKLIVGLPEANPVRHVAAPNDERVWRYKDPNITHGREPIHKVVVEGAWEDEPGIDLDVAGWFDKGGSKDVKAMGIATRKDVDYGNTSYVSSTKAKKNALPHVARATLKEKMKQQNAGTVEIDPEVSGTENSSPIDASPGDLLHIVPDDNQFTVPTINSGVIGDSPDKPDEVCGGFINNEAYLITEVEHSVTDDGEWQIFTDLGLYPDVPIKSYMSYFDPASEQWVADSEIADDGSLAGGGVFESI